MQFEHNIASLYGPQGVEWLKKLPKIVGALARKWNLVNISVFPNLTFNYVALCLKGTRPVVLKISFCTKELQQEVSALRAFDGHGCVRLIDHDLVSGGLLLEPVEPGSSLKNFFPDRDQHAIKIACRVIKELQTASDYECSDFSNIADWLKSFDKECNIPQQYLLRARELGNDLLATTAKQILLHGDLHHENILLSGHDRWVAIDPKGVIGDPVYEVGAAIRNPIPDLLRNPQAKSIIQNRMQICADTLGFEYKRIFEWVYVQGVLSACWALEDGIDATYFVGFIRILEEMESDLAN